MPLNFPANPSINDTYTFANRVWQWDGLSWQLISYGAINNTPIGNTTPSTGAFTTLSSTGNTALGNIAGHLLPAANATYDLGSPTQRWNDLYVSNSSIYLGNVALSSSGTTVSLPANVAIGTSRITVEPRISSIDYPNDDTAANPAGGQTIILNGANFQSGCEVYINGQLSASTTFINATQISFISPARAVGSYVLNVANPDGGVGTALPGLLYSGLPTWVTAAGSRGSVYETNAFSTTVTATGDAPITYEVAAGNSLPGNMVLNTSTGGLSVAVTPVTNSDTTYSFNLNAIDAQLQETARQFSVTYLTDVVTWSTPANASSYTWYEQSLANNTVNLSATSAAGKSVSYTLQSGSLPGNVTIQSTQITGNNSPVQANTAAVIRATAATTNRFADRTLYFTVIPDVVTWVSPANNTSFTLINGVSYTQSLSSTTGSGRSVNYSIASGSLPANVTISGSTISGTPTGTQANTAVVIRATSSANASSYSDRTFYFEVIAATPPGQQAYTTPGTYSWTAPAGVTSVCVVCVGAGSSASGYFGTAGAGGALAWKNDISVTPGQSYTVVVGAGGVGGTGTGYAGAAGGQSSFSNGVITVIAGGGGKPAFQFGGTSTGGAPSGTYDGGGNGGGCQGSYSSGSSAGASTTYYGSGGGGAGGYTGNGGLGGGSPGGGGASYANATAGAGGGGGGGQGAPANLSSLDFSSAGGGGVGILGQGASGNAGVKATTWQQQVHSGGYGGSGGADGVSPQNNSTQGNGGNYGGGGGTTHGNNGTVATGNGGSGAVRIIWGTGRSFPSNAGDA